MAKSKKGSSRNPSKRPPARPAAPRPLPTPWPQPPTDDWVVVKGEVFAHGTKGLGKLLTKFSQHLRFVGKSDKVYHFVAIDGKAFDPKTTKPPVSPPATKVELRAADYIMPIKFDYALPGLNDNDFDALVARAKAHFHEPYYSKPNTYPSHGELKAYFLKQKLADGSPLNSDHLATMLATAALPLRLRNRGRPPREKG